MRNRADGSLSIGEARVCLADREFDDQNSIGRTGYLTVDERSPSRVRLSGHPDSSLQGETTSSSPKASLTFVLPRVFDFGQFDTDFFENRRSTGEPPAERVDKTIVALGAFGTGCGA